MSKEQSAVDFNKYVAKRKIQIVLRERFKQSAVRMVLKGKELPSFVTLDVIYEILGELGRLREVNEGDERN